MNKSSSKEDFDPIVNAPPPLHKSYLQHSGGPSCDAVLIGNGGYPSKQSRLKIIENYETFGYAVIEFEGLQDDIPGCLSVLSQNLLLGRPFVPPLYAESVVRKLYDEFGMNIVTAASDAEDESRHPAFQSRTAIELHTDGTLQEIGEIKTAALVCLESAESGGEITLFNAVGAFAELAPVHWDILQALLNPRALTRRATVGGSEAFSEGPVFAVKEGKLATRYSTTPRDHWEMDRVDNLTAAKNILESHAQPGSPYWSQIRLEKGRGLLIDNERVAHARAAYHDSFSHRRRMLRALFRTRPS